MVPECKYCKSKNIIRKGTVTTKFGKKQVYLCRNCGKKFVESKLAYKTYSPAVIIDTISNYNLGNTFEKTVRLTNKRYKVVTTKSSVHRWLNEFKDICTYSRIRESVIEKYGKDIIVNKAFEHNDLTYNFKYHRPKLDLSSILFPSLADYIKRFEHGCPKFFEFIENRCSQQKIEITIKKEEKYEQACKLADLALKACSRNTERHKIVEDFILVNDAYTVAVEVPVWLWEKNLNIGISGHIDLLQIKNNKIYIMDFKPEARRENEQKVASQLHFYASGLSFRTKLSLDKFVCAWFDDKNYYEFYPKEAIVRFAGVQKTDSRRFQTRQKSLGFDIPSRHRIWERF